MQDYPAAHSMDSTWFAVDADGEVAAFETGEGGCMPADGFPAGGEAGSGTEHALENRELLAYALHARARRDERLAALLPADPRELAEIIENGEGIWDLVEPLMRAAGVWTYACHEGMAMPYVREGEVGQRLRIDECAEELRRRFVQARLPVRFREAPAVAPGEHVPVVAWGPVWVDLAGRPHPTKDGGSKWQPLAPEIAEWAAQWRPEPAAAETLEGERFYEAVGKLVASGASSSSRADEGGGGGGLLGRLAKWFRDQEP